jgi:NAD(P)-dependent dehydrogenase (short-subunit alcohol dehydrogenase family)
MNGKIVLITGATDGIGKITAHVCLVGRNRAKTEATLQQIKSVTKNSNVELFVADLSLMSDVRRLASEFKAKHNKLDVLLNNAGAIFNEHQLTSEGLERTFALNHMSYFLLTHLLLDTLKATPNSRIISTSSAAHLRGRVDFDDLQYERKYSAWQAYSDSKFHNVVFTYALARRLEGTNVTANCFHPGFVKTAFGAGGTGFVSVAFNVIKNLAAITPEQGAETMIYLTSSPEVKGMTGLYFDKKKPVRSSAKSYDEQVQERFWTTSEQLFGL